jgi:pimeloyl-ACP methyl ester carboxylesterase
VLALESPFADLAEMGALRLPAPIRALALAVARYGAGVDLRAARPVDARLPSIACRAVVGWMLTDRVVPPAQSSAVAAHFPDAFVFAASQGAHLDLIEQEPWRALVRSALDEAAR